MRMLRAIGIIISLVGVGQFLKAENLSDLISGLSHHKTDVIEKSPAESTNDATQAKDSEKSKDSEELKDSSEESKQVSSPATDSLEASKEIHKEAPKNVVSDAVSKKELIEEHPEAKVMPHTVAHVMPKMPVSPIHAKEDTSAFTTHVEPKVVTTSAPPIVSKSISAPVQVVDVHEEASSGLDTLNVDSGGNWLEKRIWYQKSEQLFEVIRANVQKAADLRMKFVHAVNQVGHQIDEFYQSNSFQKGEIDEMLSSVLQALANQTEVRGGDLSSSERSLKAKVQAEQKQFESMSKDLKLIDDLDEQIDKTMMKAFKEIDVCRGLETRAWNNFKEIGLELDDKKARVLYYEMENFHKNIEQKIDYLQNNLLHYLQNQLISKVNDTMTQIKTSSQDLDSKGLSLKTLLAKDEQGDLIILKEREKMQEKEAEKEALAQVKTAKAPLTWYEKLWNGFVNLVQPVTCKIYEWVCIILCCVKSVLCKIQQWICAIFGY